MLKDEVREASKNFLHSQFEIEPELWDYCQDITNLTGSCYILYVTPEGCDKWSEKMEDTVERRTITYKDLPLEPGVVVVPCRPKGSAGSRVQLDIGHLRKMNENHPNMAFAALLTLMALRDLGEVFKLSAVPDRLAETPNSVAFLEKEDYSQMFCGPFMQILRRSGYRLRPQDHTAMRNLLAEFLTNLQSDTTGAGGVALLAEDIYQMTNFDNDFPIKAMQKNPHILAETADSYIRNEFSDEADQVVKAALEIGFDDILSHLERLKYFRLTDITLLDAKISESLIEPGVLGLILAGMYSKNPTDPSGLIHHMKELLSNGWEGTGWELIETAQAALS